MDAPHSSSLTCLYTAAAARTSGTIAAVIIKTFPYNGQPKTLCATYIPFDRALFNRSSKLVLALACAGAGVGGLRTLVQPPPSAPATTHAPATPTARARTTALRGRSACEQSFTLSVVLPSMASIVRASSARLRRSSVASSSPSSPFEAATTTTALVRRVRDAREARASGFDAETRARSARFANMLTPTRAVVQPVGRLHFVRRRTGTFARLTSLISGAPCAINRSRRSQRRHFRREDDLNARWRSLGRRRRAPRTL